jgi:hypothetical protein
MSAARFADHGQLFCSINDLRRTCVVCGLLTATKAHEIGIGGIL